jgi:putative ABC transport system substrate-binding protein
MLKTVLPDVTALRVFALPVQRKVDGLIPSIEAAAAHLNLAFSVAYAGDAAGYAEGFSTMRRGRSAAYIGSVLPRMVSPQTLASLAIEHGIPVSTGSPDFVRAGAFMCYTFDWDEKEQRVAAILDKLLRGANPALIPFEQPNVPVFVINRATARALGITIAPEVLLRVTSVVG